MEVSPSVKDPMKSTWRLERRNWRYYYYLYEWFGLHSDYPDREPPVHSKQDSVPYLSDWQSHRWVLFHALIPLALHQTIFQCLGRNLYPIEAFIFYTIAFNAIAIRQLHQMRRLGYAYGFFDGDQHKRDGIPDGAVGKVLTALIQASTYRPMMAVLLSYRRSQTPASINWGWLPLEIGLYGIILDFWFYCYHRAMHESETLWKYHRTHHFTKHPSPLLTVYADAEQEFFDIAGIPLLTWATMRFLGMPMGFFEWWICYQYVGFAELFGHSGIRIAGVPPSTLSWLLRIGGWELVIEDHDLHHRKSWKMSGNYGKQTRLWDKIFGTCKTRIESTKENIDYNNRVKLSLV
jgi:sterol desaturase/sphingolipid hydroxylase (fatty acid hydroxylase superfamily)